MKELSNGSSSRLNTADAGGGACEVTALAAAAPATAVAAVVDKDPDASMLCPVVVTLVPVVVGPTPPMQRPVGGGREASLGRRRRKGTPDAAH